MNNKSGLLLAGVCCLAFASAAKAQVAGRIPVGTDAGAHPSHLPLNIDAGDLEGAEAQLARRLQHAQELQQLQDIVKPLLQDPQFEQMVHDQFKDLPPDEIAKLKETIRNNPQLLDDPKLREALKEVNDLKNKSAIKDLPQKVQADMAQWAKDVLDKQKPPDSGSGDPMNSGSTIAMPPTAMPLTPPMGHDQPALPPPEPKLGGWQRDLLHGLSGLAKDVNGTPEGEAFRTEALRDLARLESNSSGPSGGLTDFLKGVLSPNQASWLSQRWKSSPDVGLSGWNTGGAASTWPSAGGSVDGPMDGILWIAALALLIAAGWTAVAAARRRAGRKGARPWSAGPWPVRPSQVSTRGDLIRAFEHLAYLLLGPSARSLNHLDVAARLSRSGAADRLAHLYEQARYAPPDEALPDQELTAARGDLAALAGAAA
ncbi:MAG TPA: hypothetical protein VMS17_16000 [Gemmataceae bacterium]|nr:hypothetical protein [Gemmataceae bacterium]